MTDCKTQFISEVSEALIGQIDLDDISTVSNEMAIALRDYELTKRVTDLVKYDGANEMIIKRYKACLIIAGRSPKTIEQYERTVKKMFFTLQKNFVDMTVSDVRYYLAYEKNRGVSNRTLENTRVQISTFFSWLLDEDLIVKNPCRSVPPIKYTREVKHPFSAVEIDALRSACKNKKERAIIELLLASGIRVSELCSLRISDIDFNSLTITVREGKGGKQRVTYINDLASKHLVEYLTDRTVHGDHLFYNKKKQPLNPGGVRYLLKTLEEQSGVSNVHPHRFRRTFATTLASRGMEIQEISRLLGHTNLDTTLVYVYMSDEKVHNSYLKYCS